MPGPIRPSARAGASARSRTRPRTKGPRSLTVTTTDLPRCDTRDLVPTADNDAPLSAVDRRGARRKPCDCRFHWSSGKPSRKRSVRTPRQGRQTGKAALSPLTIEWWWRWRWRRCGGRKAKPCWTTGGLRFVISERRRMGMVPTQSGKASDREGPSPSA
jgi:hypothetical protein